MPIANGGSRLSLFGTLLPVAVCSGVGLLCAYSIASEPIAYIASMFYGIFLYMLIPIAVASFIVAVIFACSKNLKIAVPLVACSVVLPTSYVGGLKAFEGVGLAQYKGNPINEMRPIGWDVKHRIVFVFRKEVTQDQIKQFDENVLRKRVPQPNGVLLAFADGICNFSYPRSPDATIVDVPFCADATEEQKQRIRNDIVSSPLVNTAFEDVDAGEVKRLK